MIGSIGLPTGPVPAAKAQSPAVIEQTPGDPLFAGVGVAGAEEGAEEEAAEPTGNESCDLPALKKNLSWCLAPTGDRTIRQKAARDQIIRGWFCNFKDDIQNGYLQCMAHAPEQHAIGKACTPGEMYAATLSVMDDSDPRRPANCERAEAPKENVNLVCRTAVTSCTCEGTSGICPDKHVGARCECNGIDGLIMAAE